MILKFTPHYWSGATYKAHEGDTINYYEAENGYIISICDFPKGGSEYAVYRNHFRYCHHEPERIYKTMNEARLFCYEESGAETAENDLPAMAAGIYEAALDMDFGDYTETRDEEISRLSAALASLDHDGVLFQALQRIYG